MNLDVVQLLADLVRIPSVNPMGRNVSGEIYLEHRVTDFLQGLFEKLGLAWERHTVAPGRDNIIVRVDGPKLPDKGGRVLMLEAHQDTVPVEGMTIDPFAAEIKDNRLYGRGACDIKGGLAAMIAALARLADEKPKGRPTVVLACTVNEEHGFTGATHWAATYAQTRSVSEASAAPPAKPKRGAKSSAGQPIPAHSKLLPRVPDACIVAEPTRLNVVVAHKGAVRWRLHTTGIATHSSQPHLGDNAIYHMARVLQVLELYARDVVPTLGSHPLVGHPTLSVGLISGGISVNTVPDRATIEIDRRVLPGEDPRAAFDHAVEFVNSRVVAGTPVIHEEPFMSTRGLADDKNGDFAQRLGTVIRGHVGPESEAGQAIGVPFGTDAPHYAATGCPTVVFGPGSIDQAHTADEWLDLDQLRNAAEILYDFAAAGA
ncbi:MAG: M20 family metallopeptidase [Planctomycetaceae bacterium]|nr:M20 family metallopeptidase [Planctomycetaceae bacterium]